MHIDVHDSAVADLERISKTHPDVVAAVLATLELLEADPRVLDKLTNRGNNQVGSARFNVVPWIEARAKKGDLWRMRILDSPATVYRLVYGYYWPNKQLCVLGVFSKDEFDYDPQSDFGKRLLSDWRSL